MKLFSVINIILLISVRINATAYEALNSWYHPTHLPWWAQDPLFI